MPDGSGFYSRQMPHYVELNRGKMPGGCPGWGGWSRLELTDTLSPTLSKKFGRPALKWSLELLAHISRDSLVSRTGVEIEFDRWIHAWICKFYSCTLYKNCIMKRFKLLELLLFVQCKKGRKGKNYHVLALAWVTSASVGFQEPWYTFTSLMRVFLRRTLAEKKIIQFSKWKNAQLTCEPLSPHGFVSPKEGFYSQVCAFLFNRLDNWVSLTELIVCLLHACFWLSFSKTLRPQELLPFESFLFTT